LGQIAVPVEKLVNWLQLAVHIYFSMRYSIAMQSSRFYQYSLYELSCGEIILIVVLSVIIRLAHRNAK
jgi:hypothetical protein